MDSTIPAAHLRQRIYILHFYDPSTGQSAKLHHAGHYCGVAEDVSARLADHGTKQGAKLTYAVRQAGLSWVVAAVIPGGRRKEKAIKAQKHGPRLCPICRGEVTLEAVLAQQSRPAPRKVGQRRPMAERPVHFRGGGA